MRFFTKFGLSLFFLISTISIEILTFCLLDIGILPSHFMYDLGFIFMVVGMIFIIPNYLAQYIVSMVILTVQIVIMYVNYSLYHLYGDVFSFDMIKLFNETRRAITSDFTFIWLMLFLVGLLIGLGVIGFYIYKFVKKYKMSYYKNFSVFIVMVVLIIQGLGLGVATQQSLAMSATANINSEDYVTSDAFLRDTTMLKIASLRSLGTYGYYVNNIMNLFSNEASKAVIDQAIKYFNSGDIFDSKDSTTFGVDSENNVIVIMVESFEWHALSDGKFNSYTFSDELTPNCYKLMSEGVIATDFFSKSKTNISEGIGILGSYPIGKHMNQVATKENADYYGFSMPNILSDLGYSTYYLHANNSSFYQRGNTFKYLGFDNEYYASDVLDNKIDWNEWIREEDFVRSAIDDGHLIPYNAGNGEKFYSFWTTVSSHGPYTTNKQNQDQKEYRDDVLNSNWYRNIQEAYSDLDNSDEFLEYLVNYQAAIMGFDKALGVVIDELKERNIYDNTTILIYSDHNAYYHTLSNDIKGVDNSDYSNIELNTVPMILKSSGLNSKINELGVGIYQDGLNMECDNNKVLVRNDRYGNLSKITNKEFLSTSRFSSAYDIVPTLLDLLGIEFNRNLYGGNSLFAPLNNQVTITSGDDNSTYQEDIAVYYSHTGGVYGKFGHTKDLVEYTIQFPENISSSSYITKFQSACKSMILKLNYISTLYSYGTFKKI